MVWLALLAPGRMALSDEDPGRLTRAQRYARARQLFDGALAHYNLGEYDAAAEGFSRAYLYEPQPMLLFNLAQVAAKQNRREKAIELYQRYQKLSPPSEVERVQPKVDALRRTLESESPAERARVRLEAGRALLAHDRLDDAAEELKGGYALDPQPVFLAALGDLYVKQNDRAQAVESYKRFLEGAGAEDPLRAEVRAELEKLAPPAAARTAIGVGMVDTRSTSKSTARRLWWIAPVAAAVVAGVAVGIYFGVSNSSSVPTYPVMFPK